MRVQMNLSESMVSRVDNYAKMFGISRSAFCSMMVGQGVINLDYGKGMIEKAGAMIGENLFTEEKLKKFVDELNEDMK